MLVSFFTHNSPPLGEVKVILGSTILNTEEAFDTKVAVSLLAGAETSIILRMTLSLKSSGTVQAYEQDKSAFGVSGEAGAPEETVAISTSELTKPSLE